MIQFIAVVIVLIVCAVFIYFTEKEAKKKSEQIEEVWAKYRQSYLYILEHERREKEELNQKLARIENLLHHFVEQKAPRVSDAVDGVIEGKHPISVNPNCSSFSPWGGSVDDVDPAGIGFEVSRGTPFQKEQRAAGNAVFVGIPTMGPEPKFRVGDYVQVKETPHWFIVGSVVWNEKDGCYTYSDGSSLATIHREFKLQKIAAPRFEIGQTVYKTNETDCTFRIWSISFSQPFNQFTYQGGADQPYWICEQDLEICGVKP